MVSSAGDQCTSESGHEELQKQHQKGKRNSVKREEEVLPGEVASG